LGSVRLEYTPTFLSLEMLNSPQEAGLPEWKKKIRVALDQSKLQLDIQRRLPVTHKWLNQSEPFNHTKGWEGTRTTIGPDEDPIQQIARPHWKKDLITEAKLDEWNVDLNQNIQEKLYAEAFKKEFWKKEKKKKEMDQYLKSLERARELPFPAPIPYDMIPMHDQEEREEAMHDQEEREEAMEVELEQLPAPIPYDMIPQQPADPRQVSDDEPLDDYHEGDADDYLDEEHPGARSPLTISMPTSPQTPSAPATPFIERLRNINVQSPKGKKKKITATKEKETPASSTVLQQINQLSYLVDKGFMTADERDRVLRGELTLSPRLMGYKGMKLRSRPSPKKSQVPSEYQNLEKKMKEMRKRIQVEEKEESDDENWDGGGISSKGMKNKIPKSQYLSYKPKKIKQGYLLGKLFFKKSDINVGKLRPYIRNAMKKPPIMNVKLNSKLHRVLFGEKPRFISLSDQNRRHLQKVYKKSGLQPSNCVRLKIAFSTPPAPLQSVKKSGGKTVHFLTYKEAIPRLKALLGAIQAGNNNPALANEAIELTDLLARNNKLTKKETNSIYTLINSQRGK
jgi:hypothetical protein